MTKKDTTKIEEIKSILRSLVLALLLAVMFRTIAYEPFHIPSGSMKPTLLIGDYIFVSKSSYGYSRYSLPFGIPLFKGRLFARAPERGDPVVFKLPSDTSVNYIKRLIGLPGDKIQIIQGQLMINGKLIERQDAGTFTDENGTVFARYLETLPNGKSYHILDQYPDGPLDNVGVYTVPKEHYFLMGDNRDNSQDSRVLHKVGYIPRDNLVGKAKVTIFPEDTPIWKIWATISQYYNIQYYG